MSDNLKEICGIYIYCSPEKKSEENYNSLVFRPLKVISKDDGKSMTQENKMLIDMAYAIAKSGLFILKTKNESNTKLPNNKIIYSSGWQNVNEFINEKDRTNCIYYLANPDDKTLYIGEARRLLNRVKVRTNSGDRYLVHKNQKDLDEYKFTKYRIDQLDPAANDRELHAFQDGIIGSADTLSELFLNGYKLTNSAYNKAHNKRRNM